MNKYLENIINYIEKVKKRRAEKLIEGSYKIFEDCFRNGHYKEAARVALLPELKERIPKEIKEKLEQLIK